MVTKTSHYPRTGQVADHVAIYRTVYIRGSGVSDVFKWTEFACPLPVLKL